MRICVWGFELNCSSRCMTTEMFQVTVLLASGDQAVAVRMGFHCHCDFSMVLQRHDFHILAFIVRLFWILFHLPECFRVIHNICRPLFPEEIYSLEHLLVRSCQNRHLVLYENNLSS